MNEEVFNKLYVEENLSVDGLTNKIALEILIQDIETLLNDYKEKKKLWNEIKDICNPWNKQCLVTLLTILLMILSLITLALSDLSLLLFLYILLCTFICVAITVWDNHCRHFEIFNRTKYVLSQLKECIKFEWNEQSFPHLYMPFSPCINLQWAYREGKVVNVPWSLLVKGDFILIRPGQPAPSYCKRYQPKEGYVNELKFGDVYNPIRSSNSRVSRPTARPPVQNTIFVLEQSPYIRNLETLLFQHSKKPVDYFTSTLYSLNTKCIQLLLYPTLFILVIIINLIRVNYHDEYILKSEWLDLYLIQPIRITLPLLPFLFPLSWYMLNSYGNAVLQSSFQEDFSVGDTNLEVRKVINRNHILNVDPVEVQKNFISCLKGEGKYISKTANLVHVLGSVSAVCCIDKKGILSWPNPTGEKVFFLRSPNDNDLDVREVSEEPITNLKDEQNSVKQSHPILQNQTDQNLSLESQIIQSEAIEDPTVLLKVEQNSNVNDQEGDNESKALLTDSKDKTVENEIENEETKKKKVQIVEDKEVLMKNNTMKKSDKGFKNYKPIPEVLDLTHNKLSPFELNFDNAQWSQYILSLKPLGLAILLNTCNKYTQSHYTQFCSHVTCQALYSDLLVPVANRRCLCELARQIGFAYNAGETFKLELQLSTYRHFPAEKMRRDISFAKSLQLPVQTKLKFPFPHMVAVAVKESTSKAHELLSQGTADILLDSCIDYWNGEEVVPLTLSDRKKIQDFYQRTSLLAYCTAFAYRPLMNQIDPSMSNVYIELSPHSKDIYQDCLSPELLYTSNSAENIYNKEKTLNDVAECFQEECNQVFIGMVTMQYQTMYDMVDLVEELDHACVRFVHFSKENELRSRVFSEKMGLESGWNCHISLSSDQKKNQIVVQDEPPDLDDIHANYDFGEKIPLLNMYPKCSLLQSRGLSVSAPNTSIDTLEEVVIEQQTSKSKSNEKHRISLGNGDEEDDDLMDYNELYVTHQHGSNSCLTEVTDQGEEEDGVGFDMSNRARLPRGIENIRPHLQNVDNVPLQVSLFTECTPDNTREMLSIMQEYEQIICILGSCANNENFTIFTQADASIAIEPLYPQVCQRIPVYPQGDKSIKYPHQISHVLNSVPCCLKLNREKSITISSYIMEARHLMQRFWSCAQYWLCSITILTILQFLSFVLYLPPMLSLDGLVFLILIIVPAISMSLVGTGFVDSKKLKQATSKNQNIFNLESAIYILWCYGFKYVLTIIFSIVLHITLLSSNCHAYLLPSNSSDPSVFNSTQSPLISSNQFNNSQSISDSSNIMSNKSKFACDYVYPASDEHHWLLPESIHNKILSCVQNIQLCLLIIHFLIISYSFVYRDYNIWTKRHYYNFVWMITSCVLFLLSALYAVVLFSNDSDFAFIIELHHVIIFCISAVVVFIVCEFVKLQEIEKNVRYQKRARLDFDTKLGMNSPF